MILRLSFVFALLACSSALSFKEECLNYTVYPVQYDITIIPYIYKNGQSFYDCDLSITIMTNAQNIQSIEMDARDFNIRQSIQVLYQNRDIVNTHRPYEYNDKTGKLYIYLKEPLLPHRIHKALYTIRIKFRKNLNLDGTGIMLIPYEGDRTSHMVLTRLGLDKAKYFFPCFDNPRFESGFKFRVYVIPNSVGTEYFNTSVVISKEHSRQTLQDGTVVIEYLPSPQVALHQIGFHYSNFGSREVIARNTNDTFVIWAPNHKLNQYDFILRYSEILMNLIIEYASVNRRIMYGPINVIAVPSNLDGYEVGSWNLLTNGESRLAFVPQFTSIKQQQKMMFELTQQMCRIWLGNPGESERTVWKEEWFKEGVATYLAYYMLAQYDHGSHNPRQRLPLRIYGLEMKHKAMAEDWLHSTPALATFNRSLAVEMPPRYKELVTMKTASILWMIENWLDSDRFHNALVKYINTRRGIVISLDDFLLNLDRDTVECQYQFFNGSTSSRILNSWIHQSGYPVINVHVFRDRSPNVVQLKQQKFSFIKDHRRDSRYLIPISYVTQNHENCFNCYRPRFTIDQTYSFEENLNGGWILLNRNASGYYRVNYDTETWKLLAKTLRDNTMSIDALNRAQIVNDVFALYAAGDLDLDLAMDILSYLDKETDPIVWESAISGYDLMKIEGAGCEMTKNLYLKWQKFMSMKISPMYRRVRNELEQNRLTRLFRSKIIDFACHVDHDPCVDDMINIYEEYNKGAKRLDPDTRESCYYTIIQTNNNFGRHGFNIFEVEDKVSAEHKYSSEHKFMYRVPVGAPELEKLVMSTTSLPELEASTQQTTKKPNQATSLSKTTSFAAVLALFAIVMVR